MLSLFRFRISSHNLRIETGRYTRPKTPEIERKCLYCSAQALENELHFLTECPLYLMERNELFDVIIKYIPNVFNLIEEEKFSIIMSSEIKPITDAQGKYVYKCFKKIYEIQTMNTGQSTDTNLQSKIVILEVTRLLYYFLYYNDIYIGGDGGYLGAYIVYFKNVLF